MNTPLRPPCADPARERRLTILERFLSPERQARLEAALSNRITGIVTVIEGLYDRGNAAAIMRSCDGLGVHQVSVIDTCSDYKPSRNTTMGAHKWLDLRSYPGVAPCVAELRAAGYTIAGAALGQDSIPLPELDPTRPIAVVFGNEHAGLSQPMMDACDALFHIDMRGLSQSFNVSVAAAITLHDLTRRAALTRDRRGDMDAAQLEYWRDIFYFKAVRNAEAILAHELGGQRALTLMSPDAITDR